MLLDGKLVSQRLKQQLKESISVSKIQPGLAVILVGEDPASLLYVNHKVKACAEVGIYSEVHKLNASITEAELNEKIQSLNHNKKIHGILLQLPLPKKMDAQKMLDCIAVEKDVDAIGSKRMGELLLAKQTISPCTPSGILALLDHYDIKLDGKHAVVIGRSTIVGKPMAQLFVQRNATVTICHSRTKNLRDFTKAADIVVVAAGKPHLLTKEDFSAHTVVVDVGIHRSAGGSICGDVDGTVLKNFVKAYTPVPGGVGPLTIAYLLQNTFLLSQEKR